MDFNSAIDKIMPDVRNGSTEPFIIYRDIQGEWHSDYTQNQQGERFDWIDAVITHDPLAMVFTGKDFGFDDFSDVYNTVLGNRVRLQFYNDRDSGLYSGDSVEAVLEGMDERKAHALSSFFFDNVGAFSSKAKDYLATLNRPLSALKEMCPFNMATGREDWTYNKSLAADAADYIENAVYERTQVKNHINDREGNRMTYDEAIHAIMPEVESGSKEPFIIYRDNMGGWHSDFTKNQYGETFDWVKDIKDPFAASFSGEDFSRGSFPFVYDKILIERLRAEYGHAPVKDADPGELTALMNLLDENIGEFSSEVTDYLTMYDRPLAALYDMTPLSLVSDDPVFGYDYDKIGGFMEAVESHINDLLNNRKKLPEISIEPERTQSEKSGKRNIEGYEETACIQLAGKYTVFAENPAAESYLVCSVKNDNPFGIEERYDGIVTADFLEAMREFVTRADGLLEKLEMERRESGLPFHTLTAAEYCIPDSQKADWDGKLIIVKPEILAPEYRSAEHQLALVIGGFGARAEARGRAVYVKELYSDKKCRYDRHNIAGLADLQKIPDWAVKKLSEHHERDKWDTDAGIALKSENKEQSKAPEIPKKKPTLQEKLDNAKQRATRENAARKDNRDEKPKKRDERE